MDTIVETAPKTKIQETAQQTLLRLAQRPEGVTPREIAAERGSSKIGPFAWSIKKFLAKKLLACHGDVRHGYRVYHIANLKSATKEVEKSLLTTRVRQPKKAKKAKKARKAKRAEPSFVLPPLQEKPDEVFGRLIKNNSPQSRKNFANLLKALAAVIEG